MNQRRRRQGRGNPQNPLFNWNAVIVSVGIMMFGVVLLVWFRKNEVRYALLEDAAPFLMIVAGVNFSFGWKTISDEIALAYPGGAGPSTTGLGCCRLIWPWERGSWPHWRCTTLVLDESGSASPRQLQRHHDGLRENYGGDQGKVGRNPQEVANERGAGEKRQPDDNHRQSVGRWHRVELRRWGAGVSFPTERFPRSGHATASPA